MTEFLRAYRERYPAEAGPEPIRQPPEQPMPEAPTAPSPMPEEPKPEQAAAPAPAEPRG